MWFYIFAIIQFNSRFGDCLAQLSIPNLEVFLEDALLLLPFCLLLYCFPCRCVGK